VGGGYTHLNTEFKAIEADTQQSYMVSLMVDWKNLDVQPIIKHCQETYERYNVYPSIRDIFYAFVDELWPNTKSVYKALSKWLVVMRLNGKIDWRMMRDGSGREYEEGDWIYDTPSEHVESWLNLFVDVGSRYHMPVWLNQPKKVIVACEKEGDYPIVKAILSAWHVDTFYSRGYSGWRPLFEAVEKVKAEGKDAIVIALADFDPSGGEGVKEGGADLVSFLLTAFRQLGLSNVRVEKVAVTKEQIEQFKLPHRPEDAKEIEKLRKDPRFKKWPYGLYRVETAALRKKAADYFDKTIKEAVEKHFDQEIYAKIKSAEEEARKKIKDFFEDNEDLIDEFRERLASDERLD